MSGLFVTGTDTGVGKTLVTVALLRAFAGRGLRAAGMKPVAAGLVRHQGEWVNEDVIAIRAASNVEAPLDLVNPCALKDAIAPHIAAMREGVTIDRESIVDAFLQLEAQAQLVVVEGVGGFRVPLGARFDSADLAATLKLPVILVVGVRLGCLNHALLTVDAIQRYRLVLAGWIANVIDADMNALNENIQALDERIDAPCLGIIPHLAGAHDLFPERAASCLQIEHLKPFLGEPA
jgi:dethiobiotin synthetase